MCVLRLTYWLVGHGVVPPEEARRDEVGDDDVYGVVIMSQKDAEDAEDAERRAPPVIAPEASRGVCVRQKVFRVSFLFIFFFFFFPQISRILFPY